MANPHAEALDTAFAYIKEQLAATDFVVSSTTKIGCKISMKTLPGQTLPITRGDVHFPAPHSIETVVAFLRDLDSRKSWDSRFEGGRIVHKFSDDDLLIYSQQKGQWPVVSGREFTVAYRVFREESGAVFIIQTSVSDPLTEAHADKGRVRGTVTAGWCLIPAAAGGVDVSYIVNADPAGSLPAALVRMVAAETPACAGNVLEQMNKKL